MSDKDSASSGHKTLYYGETPRALYYGGNTPAYYSSSQYGSTYYYGGSGSGGDEGDDAILGQISITRILRVCMQRWVTIAVFIIVGFVASFAIFKISPVIYEATSVIEMRMRRASYTGVQNAVIDTDIGSNMNEVFNTRLARLRSRRVIEQIMTQYRSDYPSSTVTDEELISTLVEHTEMTLQRMSRLINISVRSTDAQLASDLANAYSKVIVVFTSDQNKTESEVAVSWLASTTEQQKRQLERADKEMLDYSTVSQVDTMKRETELSNQALATLSANILKLEGEITTAAELKKTLTAIQSDPDKFGSLPENVPRTQEIGLTFQILQKALTEKNALLARFTANHPEVKVKEKEVEAYRHQFADVVARSLQTAKANLDLLQRQLDELTPRRDELTKKLAELEQKTITATMRLEQLQREREVAALNYQTLLKRKGEAELAADENTAIIKPVESAVKPERPVLPNPLVIFPAGPALGLIFGILFVLILDHLEDCVVGISDIEQRLRLKTLAVLPHVRRKKREQLARLVYEDKFSQYAEAVAGLRNLLDSPRYHEMSKVLLCISTQPGEGKTVTSCAIAQSCAQSGQKTLLIDFDMRHPRLARIFGKGEGTFVSLPKVLAKGEEADFESLPVSSDIPNLDLILSWGAPDVNPAMLMGGSAIVELFKWAREHYDRILVDSPPFGIVGDVMTLASLVDSVMIMCCPDRTRFQPIKHAARSLMEAGARVIGVIVNDVDFGRRNQFSHGDYHYRYSSRYGYSYSYTGQQGQKGKRGGSSKSEKPVSAPVNRAGAASPQETKGSGEKGSPVAAVSRQDKVEQSMTDDDE